MDKTDRLTELSIFEGEIPRMRTLKEKAVWAKCRNYFKSWGGRMKGKGAEIATQMKKEDKEAAGARHL